MTSSAMNVRADSTRSAARPEREKSMYVTVSTDPEQHLIEDDGYLILRDSMGGIDPEAGLRQPVAHFQGARRYGGGTARMENVDPARWSLRCRSHHPTPCPSHHPAP
jgi:hypothetical protein